MTVAEFISMVCRLGNTNDTLRFMHGHSELEPAAIDINHDGRELIISLEEVRDLSDQEKHDPAN